MLEQYNVDELFEYLKTANLQELHQVLVTVQQLLQAGEKELVKTILTPQPTIADEINNLLVRLGITSHLTSYYYLKDILLYFSKDQEHAKLKLKTLLDLVARKNHTTSSRVERAIRHAIKKSWAIIDEEDKNEIFLNSTCPPSTLQFIQNLNHYLIITQERFPTNQLKLLKKQ